MDVRLDRVPKWLRRHELGAAIREKHPYRREQLNREWGHCLFLQKQVSHLFQEWITFRSRIKKAGIPGLFDYLQRLDVVRATNGAVGAVIVNAPPAAAIGHGPCVIAYAESPTSHFTGSRVAFGNQGHIVV